MAEYKAFLGFIQFDPNERETPAKQQLRDVVIAPIGYGKDVPNVRVTIWPEFGDTILSKGDLIAVQGKYTTPNVKGKTYHNLSASQLAVVPQVAKSDVEEIENPVEEEDEDFDPGF